MHLAVQQIIHQRRAVLAPPVPLRPVTGTSASELSGTSILTLVLHINIWNFTHAGLPF